MNLPADAFGTPGARAILHVIQQFEDGRGSDDRVFNDSTERSFLVSARLSKAPVVVGPHIKADFGEQDGDCYLMAQQNALRIDTSLGRYHIKKNEIGELSL